MGRLPPLKDLRLDDADEKRSFNRLHFAEAARHYDRVTSLLSFGRDATWKRNLVRALPGHPEHALDLACGTGDLCFLLAERYPALSITGLDLTPEMLRLAKHRNHFGPRVCFMEGDMCRIPAADEAFDLVTGAYALRNAPDLHAALQEIHRVLKPGGTAAFLDFSKSPLKFTQMIQYALLRFWGGLWGLILHGNPAIHGYIASSLRSYPDRQSLNILLQSTGFERSTSRLLFGGMLEATGLRKPLT